MFDDVERSDVLSSFSENTRLMVRRTSGNGWLLLIILKNRSEFNSLSENEMYEQSVESRDFRAVSSSS